MLFPPVVAGRARPGFLKIAFLAFAGPALVVLAGFAAAPLPAAAQTETQTETQTQGDNPSGLPLPRFVSTRSHPINVRVGPGTKYDIAWNYLVSGVPVEIIQEFDTWRKIRDVEGAEGWVHQSLLTGTRLGYAAPLIANGEVVMRAGRSDESPPRARLAPGVKVQIGDCDGQWCAISAGPPGEPARFSGFVRQAELWGVYANEVFD